MRIAYQYSNFICCSHSILISSNLAHISSSFNISNNSVKTSNGKVTLLKFDISSLTTSNILLNLVSGTTAIFFSSSTFDEDEGSLNFLESAITKFSNLDTI